MGLPFQEYRDFGSQVGKRIGISSQAGAEGCVSVSSGTVLSLQGCLPVLSLATGYRVFSQRPREVGTHASVVRVELPVVGSMGGVHWE